MLSKLSQYFNHLAKWWIILFVFIALVSFIAITLPGLQAISGDIQGLDTLFFYTPEDAYTNIASYSEEGRHVLRNFHLTADVINPLLYTSFLILLISWLFQKSFPPENRIQGLNLIPIGAAIADLLENFCIVILISVYPSQPRIIAWLSTLSTMTKFIFIYISFGLIIIGLIVTLNNKFRSVISSKRSASTGG